MLSSSSSLVCGLLMAMWWSMNECVLSATLSPKLMFFLVAMTRKTSHESQLHKHRAPAPKKRKEKKLGFLRGEDNPEIPLSGRTYSMSDWVRTKLVPVCGSGCQGLARVLCATWQAEESHANLIYLISLSTTKFLKRKQKNCDVRQCMVLGKDWGVY